MIKLKKFEDLEVGRIYYNYQQVNGWAGRYVGMYNRYLAEFEDYAPIEEDNEESDIIRYGKTGSRTLLTLKELEFDE